MRKLLVLAALVVLPLSAQAQFTLGARLGYGFGMGDVGGTLSMGDWVKSQVPLQLDALYRVAPNVAVGAYFSRAFGQLGGDVNTACDMFGSDCSGRLTRLGAQATYSFAAQQMAPWIGAGLGYEWNTLEENGVALTFKGFELNLQAGTDFKVNEQFSVGPYLLLAVGQYSDATLDGQDAGTVDKKMHQWLNFGIRGKFDL
jgi:hypothetical protein